MFSNTRIKGSNAKIQCLPINYRRKEQANGYASRRIALHHLGSGLSSDLRDSLRRPVPYSQELFLLLFFLIKVKKKSCSLEARTFPSVKITLVGDC